MTKKSRKKLKYYENEKANFTMKTVFSFLNQKSYSAKVSYYQGFEFWQETHALSL